MFKGRFLYLSCMAMLAGLLGAYCYAQSNAKPDYLAGSSAHDEPQAVYSLDANDSWNRIFYGLFTRTVQTRLSTDFPIATPFQPAEVMGHRDLKVSTKTFARIESGDRAIDPLYPSFFNTNGAFEALREPRSSCLESALTDALAGKNKRSASQRAVMQSDVWAAYDILARKFSFVGEDAEHQREIQKRLLPLLARFIKKLALTSQEINALPNNYALAARQYKLPNLFDPKSGWMEIEWLPHNEHNEAFKFRRSTRIFFKPKTFPQSEQEKKILLEALKPERLNQSKLLDSVALVLQNLLVNSEGKAVPSPLTYEVQLRHFAKHEGDKARVEMYEFNRQFFFAKPKSGGLKAVGESEPAYLPTAGNDLTFASPHSDKNGGATPILAPLRTRCVSCHGDSFQVVMTLSQHFLEGMNVPPIRQLNSMKNARNLAVAAQKTEREEFKALIGQWAE